MKLLTTLGATLLLAATPATAATITRNGDRIVLTGTIEPGDDAAFAAAIDGNVKTVVLGSDGGRVSEAMTIGRLIRKRHLDTAVPSSCVSACALIWAAGVKRSVDGRLAMHCPTFPGELQCYAPTRQVMMAYLREMGAPPAVIELQEAAGSTSSLWVEPKQLEAAQPVADGAAAPLAHGEAASHGYRDDDLDEPAPPPPRRHPRPRYRDYPPAPPPGVLVEPWTGRTVPCALTVLTFGMLPVCI